VTRSVLLVAATAAADVLSLVGLFAFAALLPQFVSAWSLTNSEAGWISGMPLASYAIAVSLIVSLTDKVDARHVFCWSALLGAAALAGFALFAQGFWTALAFRALTGVAMAGTYVPALRVLVDRYSGTNQSRAVAFYTASFSLGTASSFFVAGEVGVAAGWQAAYWAAAVLSAASVLLIWPLRAVLPQPPKDAGSVFDIRPVFRNRRAMAYVLAYAAHGWELFAFRGWTVAFLVFSLSLQPEGQGWPSPTLVATASALVAMVASIVGNEIAERYGRRRIVAIYLFSSGAAAMIVGFLPGLPYLWVAALMLIYAALVQLDSASLTAGTVIEAEPGRRGATLGVHSFLGFAGSSVGPVMVGIVLDATGGGQSVASWGAGFIAMGIASLVAPLVFLMGRRPST
jgi:MFS family permease